MVAQPSASSSADAVDKKGAKQKDVAAPVDPEAQYLSALNGVLQSLEVAAASTDSKVSVRTLTRQWGFLRYEAIHSIVAKVVRKVFRTALEDTPSLSPLAESIFSSISILESITTSPSTTTTKTTTTETEKSSSSSTAKNDMWWSQSKFEESRANVLTFLTVLVIMKLLDNKKPEEAAQLADLLISYIKTLPRASVDDYLAAKAYFYYARAFELADRFLEVRHELMHAYRLAVLHREPQKQAVAQTSLMRNFLHFDEYSLAVKLVSKSSMPEGLRSNAQTARYLYYLGRLQAVQQDYPESHASLMEAIRKAPHPPAASSSSNTGTGSAGTSGTVPAPPAQKEKVKAAERDRSPKAAVKSLLADIGRSGDATHRAATKNARTMLDSRAKGFRLSAWKFAVVVELLMGGIPEARTFGQSDLRTDLLPYKNVVNAVRSGDLTAFRSTLEAHRALFEKDKTLFLIVRLHGNVIRAGIRTISLAYSQISLADVAKKLGLESAEEAEGVASKAGADGVIEAIVDHEAGSLLSKPNVEFYNSTEPSEAFHKRIAFCLQLHNEAVEAMQYPDKVNKSQKQTQEDEAHRMDVQEQLARAEEEDFDDGADFF